MNNQTPDRDETSTSEPSASETNTNAKQPSLLKSSLVALAIAAVLLITIVLPAEYNIDLTGAGEKLGLTVFSSQETGKTQLTGDETVHSNLTQSNSTQSNTFSIVVPPNRGVEFKFAMQKFKKMSYEWQASSNSVNTEINALYFDLHGEPEGDTTGYYESYAITTSNEMKGSFTTPFTGSHGLYWKNKTDTQITVTLSVTGEYEVIGLK